MPAKTVLPKRKRKKVKKLNRQLAGDMFKRGTYTSAWTEQEALQYFNMKKLKKAGSVLRTGPGDYESAIIWNLKEGKVEKELYFKTEVD